MDFDVPGIKGGVSERTLVRLPLLEANGEHSHYTGKLGLDITTQNLAPGRSTARMVAYMAWATLKNGGRAWRRAVQLQTEGDPAKLYHMLRLYFYDIDTQRRVQCQRSGLFDILSEDTLAQVVNKIRTGYFGSQPF